MSYLLVTYDPSVSGPQSVAPAAYVAPALRSNLRLGRVRRPRWPSMGAMGSSFSDCCAGGFASYFNPACYLLSPGACDPKAAAATATPSAASMANALNPPSVTGWFQDLLTNLQGKVSPGDTANLVAECVQNYGAASPLTQEQKLAACQKSIAQTVALYNANGPSGVPPKSQVPWGTLVLVALGVGALVLAVD